ncbi:MAG: enoyl-CoA hydratase-related protein, partial [Acidimicrobiales bacterium]
VGFANRVVPPDELDATVDGLAATLAARPAEVVRLGRDAFYAAVDLPAREALAQLLPLLSLSTLSPEAREGITAFFEKRPPRW